MLFFLSLLATSCLVSAAPYHARHAHPVRRSDLIAARPLAVREAAPRIVVETVVVTVVTATVVVTEGYNTPDETPAPPAQPIVPTPPAEPIAPTPPAQPIAPAPPAQPVVAAAASSTSEAQTNPTVEAASSEGEVKVQSKTSESGGVSRVQSYSIPKTCPWPIKWPLPNTPMPGVDEVAKQLDIFVRPASTPDTLTIRNYCSYDIHFDHFNGNGAASGVIRPGGTYSNPLVGTVFKAYMTASKDKPVLIEYAVTDTDVYYNLSLIECLGRNAEGLRNSDTSACAGHEDGLQIGSPSAKTFQCGPGVWCDDQVYLYEENLCKANNPVNLCQKSAGLTVEFCASKRS